MSNRKPAASIRAAKLLDLYLQRRSGPIVVSQITELSDKLYHAEYTRTNSITVVKLKTCWAAMLVSSVLVDKMEQSEPDIICIRQHVGLYSKTAYLQKTSGMILYISATVELCSLWSQNPASKEELQEETKILESMNIFTPPLNQLEVFEMPAGGRAENTCRGSSGAENQIPHSTELSPEGTREPAVA